MKNDVLRNNVEVNKKIFPLHNFLVNTLHVGLTRPSLENTLSMAGSDLIRNTAISIYQ